MAPAGLPPPFPITPRSLSISPHNLPLPLSHTIFAVTTMDDCGGAMHCAALQGVAAASLGTSLLLLLQGSSAWFARRASVIMI